MFDQSFVEPQNGEKRSLSMAAAVGIQLGVLGLLAGASLAYVQRIPVVQLRALLLAPRPPLSHPVSSTKTATVKGGMSAPRLLRFLYQPVAARSFSTARPLAAAPDAVGYTDGPVASGYAADILGTVPDLKPFAQPKAVAPAKKLAGPVRVGGQVAAANLIFQPQPSYPALAKTAGVSGTVEFTAVISKDGRIEQLQLVHGHPLLIEAARVAVLQWRYRPTMLNGEPVEVVTDITVRFSLGR